MLNYFSLENIDVFGTVYTTVHVLQALAKKHLQQHKALLYISSLIL